MSVKLHRAEAPWWKQIPLAADPRVFRGLAQVGRLWLPTSVKSGWAQVVTGNGSNPSSYLIDAYTGTTASSTSLQRAISTGLNPANGAGQRLDWAKKLLIAFTVERLTTEAQTNAYVQLKAQNTHGQLAETGLGVVIANLTLSGESYGTARGTKGTTTLTSLWPVLVVIIFDGSSCEWIVEGTSLGVESTAANLPSGVAAADCFLVVSIGNGVTGGTSAGIECGNFLVWQER